MTFFLPVHFLLQPTHASMILVWFSKRLVFMWTSLVFLIFLVWFPKRLVFVWSNLLWCQPSLVSIELWCLPARLWRLMSLLLLLFLLFPHQTLTYDVIIIHHLHYPDTRHGMHLRKPPERKRKMYVDVVVLTCGMWKPTMLNISATRGLFTCLRNKNPIFLHHFCIKISHIYVLYKNKIYKL